MKPKGIVAVLCLVAGIPLLAYGLTTGAWLLILVGLGLELVFLYFAWEWISGASKPMGAETTIKPAANAAWSMKDEPVRPAAQNAEKN
jgi:hypothetical protein